MLIITSLALTLTMQAAPQAPAKAVSEEPSYWVTEYPIIIQPLVHDYRRCLNYADRRFRGEADFEAQHAADLPRCEKLKTKLVAMSEDALSQGRWSEVLEPEKAGDVFRTVGDVHVQRGRAFDRQLMALYRLQQNRAVPTDLETEQDKNVTNQ